MKKVLLAVAALLLVASCAPYRPWGGPGMGMMGGPDYYGPSYAPGPQAYAPSYGYGGWGCGWY